MSTNDLYVAFSESRDEYIESLEYDTRKDRWIVYGTGEIDDALVKEYGGWGLISEYGIPDFEDRRYISVKVSRKVSIFVRKTT